MSIDFKKNDWVVNEHGYIYRIKHIYSREELTQDVKIADGVGWFGLVTVFLDKSRLATSEEVLNHKSSKEKPFRVKIN